VQQAICPLLPLPAVPAIHHYSGGGQGGRHRTLLMSFLHDDNLEDLQRLERAGLPTELNVPDMACAVSSDAFSIVRHL